MIYRSDAGNLHREGFPAIDTPQLKKYFWLGKLHRSNGPAVTTSTGGAQYWWRGVYISAKLWQDSRSFVLKDILEIENIELRRAILEKVGFSRVEDEATVVDEGTGDFSGCKLLCVSDSGEEGADKKIMFLKLKNSTPEEDGSYKFYYLRVPPKIKKVPEGIKWSFDVKNKEEFKYLVQA